MRAAYDPTWRNLRAWFTPTLDLTSWWDEEYVSDPSGGGLLTPSLTGHAEGDSSTGASTYDLTSVTIPAGQSLLIVDQGYVPTVTPTSVTLDPAGLNIALTAAGAGVASSATSTGRGIRRYYLINPPAGTYTIRGVLSGVVLQTLEASWWTNTDTTTPLGTQVSTSATTGTSKTIATGDVPFFFGALGLRSTTAPTTNGGQTGVAAHQSSTNQQWYSSYDTGGGTFGYSWTTSDEHVLLGHELIGAAVSGGQSAAAGPGTETDSAIALGKRKVRALATATETESSIAITRMRKRVLGITTETDAPLALGKRKAELLGTLVDTQTAITLGAISGLYPQFQALGTVQSLTTTASVPYPAGLAAGDFIILYAASGDSSINSGTPSGFTAGPTISGGGVNDARVYYKTATGSESGTITVTTSAGTKGRTWMSSYRVAAGRSISLATSSTGTDTTSDTNVNPATGSVTDVTGTDMVVALSMGAGDFTAGAFTGFNLTQSGVTLGALGTRTAGRTGTNTMQHFHLDKPVTTGGSGAVTATGTGNATTATGSTIVLVLRSNPGAITQALGTATETDAAITLGRKHVRLLNLPDYSYGYGGGGFGGGGYGGTLGFSDNAMPIDVRFSNTLNPAIENDDGVTLPRFKRKTVGLTTEAESVLAVGRRRGRALGVNAETDSVLAMPRTKRRALGTATEADTAQSMGDRKTANTTTETDTALALGKAKRKALGIATETDTSITATRVHVYAARGIATETDTAVAVAGRKKVRALGAAIDTQAAQPLTRVKVKPLGVTTGTDAALALGRRKARLLGTTTEADVALATPRFGNSGGPANPALETDAAQPLAARKVKALGTATETDAAQPMGRVKARAAGVLVDAQAAQPLGRRKTRALGTLTETDAAVTLTRTRSRALGTLTGTDASQALQKRKNRAMGVTTETDAPVALGRSKARPVAFPGETDSVLPVGRAKARLLGTDTETDAALSTPRRASASAPANTALETDAAIPATRVKRKALGVAMETSATVTAGKAKRITLGTVTDVQEPNVIGRAKRKATTVPAEADAASALARVKARTLGVPGAADLALGIPAAKRKAIGVAATSDAVLAVGRRRGRALGVVVEADTTFGMGRRKRLTASWAPETDIPGSVDVKPIQILVGVSRAVGGAMRALMGGNPGRSSTSGTGSRSTARGSRGRSGLS